MESARASQVSQSEQWISQNPFFDQSNLRAHSVIFLKKSLFILILSETEKLCVD